MPEVRERRKSDKIKGKGGRKNSPLKKDVRRQMTAKLQKELTARQRGRDTGDTPEAQAAEQVEMEIHTTANSLREHTADAVSKSISRHKRKQQKKSRRKTQAPSDAAPAPMRERLPDAPHENPAAPSPGPERAPAGPSPKERMRQTAIKEKPDRPTGIRQKPAPDQKLTAAQPRPQERMRQKAKAEAQTRQVKAGHPPAPRPITGSNPVSLDNQSIYPNKERPRRPFAPKEKPPGGAFIPKTRQGGTAASKSAVKTASTAARPFEMAKRRVQRSAQRKLLRQSTARAKTVLELSRKTAAVTAKAAASLISALAGLLGGAVLIPVFCLIILAAAVIASPFGILFSNEPTMGAVPLNVAVGQLNMELSNTLETMQTGNYDTIDIQGQGPDWREVIAVFAARTAGADGGIDVAALTPDRVDRLKAVFWDMCAVTTTTEDIEHPAVGSTAAWTETVLHITITSKTAEDMRTQYAFTEYQNQALTELLAELSTMELLLTDLSVSQEQARELLQSLPAGISPERRAAVEKACQLVGKVNYFWGGKSLVIGWDSRWGTLQKVTAAGSSTTGTYRPYGLDCSGFVDWVFYNVSNGAYTIGHGGGAHAQHTYCTGISWDEARPGDLVFYPEDEHIGIVGGWDENGDLLIVHCASSANNVVITGASGFTTIGRPLYYGE